MRIPNVTEEVGYFSMAIICSGLPQRLFYNILEHPEIPLMEHLGLHRVRQFFEDENMQRLITKIVVHALNTNE